MTQPNLEVVGVRAVVQGFDAYVRQTAQVQRSTTKMARGVATAGKQANAAGTNFRKFGRDAAALGSGLLGVQIGLASVRAAFGGTVGAAIAFESSFAGVRKTVDATEAQFAVLESGFRALSQEIPITVFELNRIGEAAGQLGIETENIIEFTRTMAQLGATTNLSSEQAATALARLANITKLPQDQFEELGSTIVDLGNKFATTESEIVELSLRLAAAGSQIGLTQAEILGFATALSSLGVRAEAGGTAFSRMFVEIEKAVRSGGEDLAAFAEVAGLTAEGFVQAYQEDAAGAITTFIEGLGAIGEAGGNVFGVLERLELDNVRVRDALLRTSGGADILRRALDTGATAWQENTALQKEFARRAETSASQFQILRNRITDMGITIGAELVPPLLQGTTAFVGWLEALQGLEPLLPTIALAVGALVAALLVGKLIAFAKGIGDLVFAARLAVASNGPLIALVAAVTALDLALRAITGQGLLGTLTTLFAGNQAAARGAAEAVREYELAIVAAGSEGKPAAIALDLFTTSVKEQDAIVRQFADALAVTGPNVRKLSVEERAARAEFDRLNGAIGEQFRTMIEADVATQDLIRSFKILTPAQRAIVEDTVDMELVWSEYRGEVERNKVALDDIRGAFDRATSGQEDLGDATEDATNLFAEYIMALEDAADANKDLTSTTSLLDDALLENDAAYLGLLSSLADVNIDIATLEARTGDLTAAEEKQLDVLKDTKDALDAQVEAFDANVEAIDPFLDNIAILTGTGRGSLQELRAGLQEAGVDASTMASLWGAVNDSLEKTDAQPAIDELLRIRTVVDDPTFQTIGADIVSILAAGLSDPGALVNLFAQAQALGIDINAGIASGLASSQGGVQDAGLAALNALFDALEGPQGADTGSPSRRAEEDIGRPIAEGLIIGIVDGIQSMGGKALEAMSGFLQSMASTAETRALQDRFGRVGATLAEALVSAIEEPTERAGDRLADALQALFDEAEEAGVPISEGLGQTLMDSLALGIQLGTPEAVGAAFDAVDAVVNAIAAAAPRAIEIFNNELARFATDRQLEEQFGAKGASIMEALLASIGGASGRIVEGLAGFADQMVATLEQNLGQNQGTALGQALMDALRIALVTGGDEALAAVREILAEINAELAGGGEFKTGGGTGGGGTFDAESFNKELVAILERLGLGVFPANLTQLAAILAGGNTPINRGGRLAGIRGPSTAADTDGHGAGVAESGAGFSVAETFRPEATAPSAGAAPPPPAPLTTITLDMSGSTFTGTPEENGDAIAGAVRDILGEEQTVGAFQSGV